MPDDFLQLDGKNVLVMGVANRKSVAYHTARILSAAGARVIYSVRSESRREELRRLLGDEAEVLVCDVEHPDQVEQLGQAVSRRCDTLHGLLHSIAFADYEDGVGPFHETSKRAFLRCADISCYSLISTARALKNTLAADASVVTISISTTRMANENYGVMAPIKAALDSSVAFLAKSFSQFSRVRFNAVAAGLLKTSASAGIPGYVDAFLFAEQVIPRKQALRTEEVAATAAFLLSPASSGINAQQVVVDAGMSINYFDRQLLSQALGGEGGGSGGVNEGL